MFAVNGTHHLARARIGARRASEPKVDAPGIERGKRSEGFSDAQRRVVRQHHAAGADMQPARLRGNICDQDEHHEDHQ